MFEAYHVGSKTTGWHISLDFRKVSVLDPLLLLQQHRPPPPSPNVDFVIFKKKFLGEKVFCAFN